MDEHRQHEPDAAVPAAIPSADLLGGDPQVGGEQAGVVPQRGGDRVRRRQHERAVSARVHVELPDAHQGGHQQQRRQRGPQRPAQAAAGREPRARRSRVARRAGASESTASARSRRRDHRGVACARAGGAYRPRAPRSRARAAETGRARGRPAGSPPRRRGSRARPCAARARASARANACISPRVIASSAPNGSSRHSTGLPESSVRRKATRWRMPPESSAGRACSKPSSPSSSNSAAAPPAGLLAREPGDAQRERGVVDGAQPGQQQVALGHQRGRRARERAAVGRCSPQISSSRVLLPQPLGPTTASSSPWRGAAARPRRAPARAPPSRRA